VSKTGSTNETNKSTSLCQQVILDLKVPAITTHGTQLSQNELLELKQLREAAEKYTYHDLGTHGAWPRLVWERRSKSPAPRLDDAVEFLDKWKALRFKGGKIAFRRICR
jgi:hypothetical protein